MRPGQQHSVYFRLQPQKRKLWRTHEAAVLGPDLSKQLRKVTVRVVARASCSASYGNAVLTNRMICAAAPGKDACTVSVADDGRTIGIVKHKIDTKKHFQST